MTNLKLFYNGYKLLIQLFLATKNYNSFKLLKGVKSITLLSLMSRKAKLIQPINSLITIKCYLLKSRLNIISRENLPDTYFRMSEDSLPFSYNVYWWIFCFFDYLNFSKSISWILAPSSFYWIELGFSSFKLLLLDIQNLLY